MAFTVNLGRSKVRPVYGARDVRDIRRDLASAWRCRREAREVGNTIGVEVWSARLDRLLDQLLDAREAIR